jgi:bifunctional DNA-binding transcriptional regulator/antitoxin component of YhaV-PrlF toxin-antitoxin module
MESGKIPKIKGKGRTKKAKPVDTKVTVNGRGSLIIPKVLVESMNLKPGATFDAKKTSSGITLKAVEEKKE